MNADEERWTPMRKGAILTLETSSRLPAVLSAIAASATAEGLGEGGSFLDVNGRAAESDQEKGVDFS